MIDNLLILFFSLTISAILYPIYIGFQEKSFGNQEFRAFRFHNEWIYEVMLHIFRGSAL